ncbi:MAG: TIM barrel protein [Armatimonadetes bacterium]|nr:twin-arginine translocation signal domain-containing protein [Armatimonadota bacterium]NOG93549.1 TIM barrel protein [Armatimonadota bacterium]
MGGLTRREVIKAGAVAGAALAVGTPRGGLAAMQSKFKLNYAPHFGMFRHSGGEDPVDQLKFAADQGFTAWEDNGMMGRPTAEQERIAHEMGRLGMKMGVFVAHAEWGQPIYALGGKEARTALQSQMKSAVETAKRVNAKWCTVVPGPFDLRLQWDYQTANVVDCLKAMAEIAEPAGLVMVLEPLNPYRDHPGMFLSRIPQAYMICTAVNSQSCKILFDMYHQQITEGNIIPNIDYAWEEVAYFQIGDNPGRCEPTSGEMNYKNIFRHIHQKGFTGILGMEHGNSKPGKDGESALIAAYRQCDDF